VLIVATTANSVYAFDANRYDLLWRVNLGPPQTEQSVLCKGRTIGINGTPVIGPGAPGKQIIYLVTRSQPASGVYKTQIRALDLGSGRDIRRPAAVTATETLSNGKVVSFDPFLQFNRTGLALKDRALYFGVGANCEEAADMTTGWMFRFDASLLSKQVYPLIQQQVTGKLLGGVWMSGFAPAIDGAGNVFVVTGDGSTTFQNPRNWSNSVLKLSPSLSAVRDYFTPSNYGVLDLTDGDFGAGGVMLLPPLPAGSTTRHKLAVAMGKNPVIYLLDQTALGGFSPTNSGAAQALPVGLGPREGGVWGGPAYYGGPVGPTIYYQVKNDVLKGYHLSFAGKPTLSLAARGVSPVIPSSASPTVSSNGAHADTGIVWVVKRTTPTTLEAYDAVKLGTPLYRSSAGRLSGLAPSAMVANGRVYVTGYGTVHVFGLVN
jgi:hypothetical protein